MRLHQIILSAAIGCSVATASSRAGIVEVPLAAGPAQSSNEIGAKLLAQLTGPGTVSNVVVSPYSLDNALGMLTVAADGNTLNLLRSVRGVKGPPGSELDEEFKRQQSLFSASNSDVTLRIANSAWLKPDAAPRLAFMAGLQYLYKAVVTNVDFAKPGTADKVNAWAKDNTQGIVPHIVDNLDARTEFLLINTTYFKGKWAFPFAASASRDAAFTRFDGSRHDVPIMNATVQLPYAATNQWHAVKIPYRGDRFEMVVLTSKDSAAAAHLRDQLGAAGVLKTLDATAFEPQEVNLSLPRFRAEYGADLTSALRRLGLTAAFGRNADYLGMTGARLQSAAVIQRSVVEVGEEGTEAAAATAIGASRALVASEPVHFAADRPFYFAIVDKATGSALFMGLIADPAN